ncbi:MAG: FtsH protease activity modulator HflK [Desulfovibrionaceae bacterium]|nr:FtsH protease activity modulator HflK [Desulfovibrionaceae bacterium]
MNWDWDKLQQRRNNQPGRPAPDKDRHNEPDPQGEPGGGSPGPRRGGQERNPFDHLKEVRLSGFKWVFLAVVVVWVLTGIYIVQPDEQGVVLRFGRYVRTVGAGPHYHLPYPVEQVYRPKVSQVRQAEVGYRSQSTGGVFQQGRVQPVDEESAMLTGDENIINVQFNIQYHIKPDGAVDYLFNVTQPDAVVKKAAEAAMREVIGKTTLDAALTGGRVKIQDDVTRLLQNILDRYQVGVQVVAVQMQDVQPPRDVSDAFKDVASAREDKQRLTNQAEAYRRDILPKAQGQAAEIVNQAEAYRQTRVRAAEGEAQRFLAVLEEYSKAQDVTRKRLLYETLEEIMSRPGMEKLVLPAGVGDHVLPLLPLDPGRGQGRELAPAGDGKAAASSGASGVSAAAAADQSARQAPAYVRPGSQSRGGER